VRKLIASQHFAVANMNYRLDDNGRVFEYHMTIASHDPANAAAPGRAPAQSQGCARISHLASGGLIFTGRTCRFRPGKA
jgi:hypothetical protein